MLTSNTVGWVLCHSRCSCPHCLQLYAIFLRGASMSLCTHHAGTRAHTGQHNMGSGIACASTSPRFVLCYGCASISTSSCCDDVYVDSCRVGCRREFSHAFYTPTQLSALHSILPTTAFVGAHSSRRAFFALGAPRAPAPSSSKTL